MGASIDRSQNSIHLRSWRRSQQTLHLRTWQEMKMSRRSYPQNGVNKQPLLEHAVALRIGPKSWNRLLHNLRARGGYPKQLKICCFVTSPRTKSLDSLKYIYIYKLNLQTELFRPLRTRQCSSEKILRLKIITQLYPHKCELFLHTRVLKLNQVSYAKCKVV